jgi:hypothetical protein
MPMGRIRSWPSGTVARSPQPQYRCGGLHSARGPLPLWGSGLACEAARACMQPTRLGALVAGACAACTCPRHVLGRHDRPRCTAPSAAAHSGTDSDKRAFSGDGTHRQHGLAGRRHGCGNSTTSCCKLDDDLWGRRKRGERQHNGVGAAAEGSECGGTAAWGRRRRNGLTGGGAELEQVVRRARIVEMARSYTRGREEAMRSYTRGWEALRQ